MATRISHSDISDKALPRPEPVTNSPLSPSLTEPHAGPSDFEADNAEEHLLQAGARGDVGSSKGLAVTEVNAAAPMIVRGVMKCLNYEFQQEVRGTFCEFFGDIQMPLMD